MKLFRTRVLAVAVAMAMVLGLSGMAMAAEPESTAAAENAISVQLDGENLTFTDAVPQVKDQRTFLPFRAVFEAMGAQVSNEGNVITAVRGDKTLSMTIGSTAAAVTENGVTTDIVMDVAPYVDSATWRTYVPVRFAAQAFGCAVGWDQAAQTAVIVDVEQLVEDTLAGYTYDNLAAYLDYAAQFQTGSWAVTGTLNGTFTMMELAPMTVAATYEGVSDGGLATEMTMTMTMDMDDFLASLAELAGGSMDDLSAEDQALLDSLKTEGITCQVRGDLTEGTMYMNMSGELMAAVGLPADTWISIDMNELMSTPGSDLSWTELLALSGELTSADPAELLSQLLIPQLSTVSVDDSATAYASVQSAVDLIAGAVADQAFTQDGDNRVLTYDLEDSGVQANISLTLTMVEGAVTAYAMEAGISGTDAEAGTVSMSISESMDADNNQTATVSMDLAGLVSMEFTMTGAYTTTDQTAQTTPPEGATVISLTELLNGAVVESQPEAETAPAA